MDQQTQLDLRDSYAQEHHAQQTPGSAYAKAVATGGRSARMMGDLGAEETVEQGPVSPPLFLAAFPDAPGVISYDPVTTEVNYGAQEKDVDVPVRQQDGAQGIAHVRIAAMEPQAAQQAAAYISEQGSVQQVASAAPPPANQST